MKKSLRVLLALIYLAVSVPLACAQAQAYTPARGEIAAPLSRVVIASDYATFLNAVAASDADHLYNEAMTSDPSIACIVREGEPGRWQYKVIEGRENLPMTYVSEIGEEHYCAWLQHRNLTGMHSLSTSQATDYSLQKDELDHSLACNKNFFEIELPSIALNLLARLSASNSTQTSWRTLEEIGGVVGFLGLVALCPELMLKRGDNLETLHDDTAPRSSLRENSLTLQQFREAAEAHPNALRFVISKENGRSFIVPKNPTDNAGGKNREENINIRKALRALLEEKHPEKEEELFPRNSGMIANPPALTPEILREIFQNIDSSPTQAASNTFSSSPSKSLTSLKSGDLPRLEWKEIAPGVLEKAGLILSQEVLAFEETKSTDLANSKDDIDIRQASQEDDRRWDAREKANVLTNRYCEAYESAKEPSSTLTEEDVKNLLEKAKAAETYWASLLKEKLNFGHDSTIPDKDYNYWEERDNKAAEERRWKRDVDRWAAQEKYEKALQDVMQASDAKKNIREVVKAQIIADTAKKEWSRMAEQTFRIREILKNQADDPNWEEKVETEKTFLKDADRAVNKSIRRSLIDKYQPPSPSNDTPADTELSNLTPVNTENGEDRKIWDFEKVNQAVVNATGETLQLANEAYEKYRIANSKLEDQAEAAKAQQENKKKFYDSAELHFRLADQQEYDAIVKSTQEAEKKALTLVREKICYTQDVETTKKAKEELLSLLKQEVVAARAKAEEAKASYNKGKEETAQINYYKFYYFPNLVSKGVNVVRDGASTATSTLDQVTSTIEQVGDIAGQAATGLENISSTVTAVASTVTTLGEGTTLLGGMVSMFHPAGHTITTTGLSMKAAGEVVQRGAEYTTKYSQTASAARDGAKEILKTTGSIAATTTKLSDDLNPVAEDAQKAAQEGQKKAELATFRHDWADPLWRAARREEMIAGASKAVLEAAKAEANRLEEIAQTWITEIEKVDEAIKLHIEAAAYDHEAGDSNAWNSLTPAQKAAYHEEKEADSKQPSDRRSSSTTPPLINEDRRPFKKTATTERSSKNTILNTCLEGIQTMQEDIDRYNDLASINGTNQKAADCYTEAAALAKKSFDIYQEAHNATDTPTWDRKNSEALVTSAEETQSAAFFRFKAAEAFREKKNEEANLWKELSSLIEKTVPYYKEEGGNSGSFTHSDMLKLTKEAATRSSHAIEIGKNDETNSSVRTARLATQALKAASDFNNFSDPKQQTKRAYLHEIARLRQDAAKYSEKASLAFKKVHTHSAKYYDEAAVAHEELANNMEESLNDLGNDDNMEIIANYRNVLKKAKKQADQYPQSWWWWLGYR